ncbi:MAG: formylglycine-generating enzyme family protein, partial [Candidatus Entotheonellia bacterium]
ASRSAPGGNPGSEDGDSDEKPAHRVYLDAFYIDASEVTNARYSKFMQATGRQAPRYWNDTKFNASDQPVVGVTWDDAEAYCTWASKRLATEAEWEKAARGTDGRTYPWGDQWERTKANTSEGGPGRPTPVGSYEGGKSPHGAYDTAGNVWEWVADWYGEQYYRNSPGRNSRGPERSDGRVLRGGSWSFNPFNARASDRNWYIPDRRYDDVGLRCAKTP